MFRSGLSEEEEQSLCTQIYLLSQDYKTVL